MRIAFHAPLKPPDDPVPSGDRRMARLLMRALAMAGHEPFLATRFRSRDGAGDPAAQQAIRQAGEAEAARLMSLWRAGAEAPPDLWLTYHLYHKAPDWIGPAAADALAIPYLVAEPSYAPKRAGGPWDMGHRAVAAALARADAALCLTEEDAACVAPLLATPSRLVAFPPFEDMAPLREAAAGRERHRAALARAHALPAGAVRLLCVAMMRPGDKARSYALLAEALRVLPPAPDWVLLAAGDGPARAEVEAALHAAAPGRVRLLGALDEAALPALYAGCDLYLWPAVREAYGMAFLAAQAAGLPVVAGRTGGVPDVVADGEAGILVPVGDPGALAEAAAGLVADGGRRRRMGAAAAARMMKDHDLPAASRRLDRLLARLAGSRP